MSNLSIWLNNLAEIAQILAALAVIVTLIFIAVQVRETRRIASGGSYQTLLQNVNAFFNSLSTHEGLGRIYWNGRKIHQYLMMISKSAFFIYVCNGFVSSKICSCNILMDFCQKNILRLGAMHLKKIYMILAFFYTGNTKSLTMQKIFVTM